MSAWATEKDERLGSVGGNGGRRDGRNGHGGMWWRVSLQWSVTTYLLSAYLVWPLDYPEKMVQTFREYFVVKQKNGENARSFTFTCSIDHFLYIIPFSLSHILSVHEITENWFINYKYDLQMHGQTDWEAVKCTTLILPSVIWFLTGQKIVSI